MAEQAAIWAREWIESTRDVSCPDPAFFPPLERPAPHLPDHIDTLFPARRSGQSWILIENFPEVFGIDVYLNFLMLT
jgi:hypothetical protein